MSLLFRLWYPLAVCLALIYTAAGCVATASSGGAFKDSGYQQAVYGYAVAYRDPANKTLVGSEWQIDNYRYDSAFKAYTEKVGDEYVAVRAEDINGDGTVADSERKLETIFDLRFINKANGGVIWVKAHPFLPEQAERSLEVLLDGYADSLSGTGRYAQGSFFSLEHSKERNYTTFLTDRNLVQLGGKPALSGSIELAEVDRLRNDPNHRSGMLRLVMVKIRCFSPATCRKLDAQRAPPGPVPKGDAPSVTPANHAGDIFVTGTPADHDDLERWPMVDCKGKQCKARVGLLIVGYYNSPDYFSQGMGEFEDLLKRISFTDADPLPVPAPKPLASSKEAPAKDAPAKDAPGKEPTK
jgi:hypothetical protein